MVPLRPLALAVAAALTLAACTDDGQNALDFSPPPTEIEADPSTATDGTVDTEPTDGDQGPDGTGGEEADQGGDAPTTAPADTTGTTDQPGSEADQPTATTTAGPDPETTTASDGGVRFMIPNIHAQYPHDPSAFTQGLEFHDGALLESTGLTGRSSIRLTEPSTGEVVTSLPVPSEFFAEGVTVVEDRILQLTWQAGVLLSRDADTLAEVDRVSYDGEGWGLCDDGSRLVMSNGSADLTFRDRSTFDPIGSVTVTFQGEPVDQLNELECADGRVWANVWLSDVILSIDPDTGTVDGVVDVASLVPEEFVGSTDEVVNGIALHPDTGRWWVTGKFWPVMYEVSFVDR